MKQNQIKDEDHTTKRVDRFPPSQFRLSWEPIVFPSLPESFVLRMHLSLLADDLGENLNISHSIRKSYSFSLIDSPSSDHSCRSRNEKVENMGNFTVSNTESPIRLPKTINGTMTASHTRLTRFLSQVFSICSYEHQYLRD